MSSQSSPPTLYDLSLKQLIKTIPIGKFSSLYQILPQTSINDALKIYSEIKWSEIWKEVTKTHDCYQAFLLQHETHEMLVENYKFGKKITCLDLFKFFLWEDDLDRYYATGNLCLNFSFYINNDIRICEECFFDYRRIFGNCNKYRLRFKQKYFHTGVKSSNITIEIRDRLNWCNICIVTPLFEVQSYKKCAKRTHRKFVEQMDFDTSSSDSE